MPIALPLFPPTSSYNVGDQWLTEVLIIHSLETQKSIKISGNKDFSPLSFLLHPTFFSAMLQTSPKALMLVYGRSASHDEA